MEQNLDTESSSSSSDDSDDSGEEQEQRIDPLEYIRRSELTFKVFNVDSLGEMIMDYVIHEGDLVSSPAVKTCRLVQKSWLHTVSKLLRKRREPLFIFHLNMDNSLQESDIIQRNGKFLSLGTSPSFMGEHIPTFSIKATQDFFIEENCENFRDILLKCGSGLVKMYLEFPRNGGSMLFVFPFAPQLSLPILTDLTVQFVENDDDTVGNNGSSIFLIQPILNAAHHSLKHFKVPFTQAGAMPSGLQYLTLPVALTILDLSCQLKSKDLKMVLNSSLPHLKQLWLTISPARFGDGLLSQILKNTSKTLERVFLQGLTHDGVSRVRTYFKIPVEMKKLEHLSISSGHLELENGQCSLETFLPELNSLVLESQTVPMFRKWTSNSKFENMMELSMSLVDSDFHYDHENYFVNVEVEIMQSLHFAFPNLTILEITVCGAEASGLKYLFLEMTLLEDLEINVRRTDNLMDTDFWDSLLTGVTMETATGLGATRGFPEITNESHPSIRNLQKLHKFKISTRNSTPSLSNVLLISDLVFYFGFFKMPNLSELVFGGRFSASNLMRRKWKAGQRSIVNLE